MTEPTNDLEALADIIMPELGKQEMVLADPLTLRRMMAMRIARVVSTAASQQEEKLLAAINAEIDTWEQVPMREAIKRKLAKVIAAHPPTQPQPIIREHMK